MKAKYDVIVIGAGAAGLMCAAEAGKRGRSVWLVDHASKLAEKIRISGGGRCNFTNIYASPEAYLSQNKHFCKSALAQYTQHDFIAEVERHGIAYHEKTLGQLFCDKSANQIIEMLDVSCQNADVRRDMETSVESITATDAGYELKTSKGTAECQSLVIATGGLSIPKIGATSFGYNIAEQFGLNVLPLRAGLVPLTFQAELLERCKALAGISVDAVVSCGKISFAEGLLFTHRGLSGPSILQISYYWQEGQELTINLAPHVEIYDELLKLKTSTPKADVLTTIQKYLPKRLAESICNDVGISGRLAELSDKALKSLAEAINSWCVKPSGTEGYRTAEVTLGGVDTNELSSKTMEAKKQPGLYFIGEVVDVAGHLGGYNFQWAWSSGYVAGQSV